jgi:hypothetical protein
MVFEKNFENLSPFRFFRERSTFMFATLAGLQLLFLFFIDALTRNDWFSK